ncbi:carboxylate--amine ligase [Natronococcus wangiae]|uniref:carboxylate--amine ligase n=1 Tax=Natronococcus wangiae TaxID=3068275 RepID=UPI00273F5B33|nr:ATP-grasp domain-containing protein [Natronococcus sp. AD5]
MSDERNDPSAVVPAVQSPHAVTCLRSLGSRGVHAIAAYERPTPAFRSRYCDETVVVPSPYAAVDEYRDALLSLANRPGTRAIFPMREADVYVLSKYRSEFAEAIEPLWPAFETLETVHDRRALVEAALDAGVAAPETAVLDEVADWSSEQIVKARYALLADDYVPAARPEQTAVPTAVRYLEPGVEPDREAILEEMNHVPLVQAYVPGEEYAFWALYDRGEPVATCQKHQVRGESYAGGTSVYRETTRIPELEAAGRALLDHLEWHGFASVQFKRDVRTGEFTLLEINPRVWVSVACPVAAGIDFPHYYWQLATGESVDATREYETGVGTHRVGGELVYLLSVLRTDDSFVEPPSLGRATRDVVSSLYDQPHSDYFTLDDPLPFLSDVTDKVAARIP